MYCDVREVRREERAAVALSFTGACEVGRAEENREE
jgi:hypothetical protein